MKVKTSDCAVIKKILTDAGWTHTPECNLDGFKVDGEVNGVPTTVCILDFLLMVGAKYNSIEDITLQVVMDFLDECQLEGGKLD